jgi:hypothetical protein
METSLLKIKQVGILYCSDGYPVDRSDPVFPWDSWLHLDPFIHLSIHLSHPLSTQNHPQGDLTDVEAGLKAGKAVLDGLAGAEESIVYSSYYKAASEYYKVCGLRLGGLGLGIGKIRACESRLLSSRLSVRSINQYPIDMHIYTTPKP